MKMFIDNSLISDNIADMGGIVARQLWISDAILFQAVPGKIILMGINFDVKKTECARMKR
jgi:hypothetical protein